MLQSHGRTSRPDRDAVRTASVCRRPGSLHEVHRRIDARQSASRKKLTASSPSSVPPIDSIRPCRSTPSATSRAATPSSASCSTSSASRRRTIVCGSSATSSIAGPSSLAVLREVMALGDAAVTVLGNHDFHLLTVAAGHRKPHRDDTLDAILDAPDRDELLAWLRARPLVVAEGDLAMVHAGFLPSWTRAAGGRAVARSAGDARERPMRTSSWACSTATSRAGGRDALDGLRPPARHRQRVHAAALLHRRRHDGAAREARARARARRATCRGSRIRRAARRARPSSAATGRRSSSCSRRTC